MSNQFSNEDLVWELTHTQLQIAYLSLTLDPEEIATQTGTRLVTVNGHLTNVFKILQLQQPGQNRKLLKDRFGSIIESIWLREVHQDAREYNRKRNARRKKSAATSSEKVEAQTPPEQVTSEQEVAKTSPDVSLPEEIVEVPLAEPGPEHEAEAPAVSPSPTEIPPKEPTEEPTVTTQRTSESTSATEGPPPAEGRMYEPPPPARQRPWRDRIAGRGWLLVAFLIVSGFCLFAIRSIPLTGFFRPTTSESQTPGATEIGAPGASVEATTGATATVTLTLAPTLTTTPAVLPTAVPLPIREDFSKQYSDLWRVMGNPIVTDNVGQFGRFRGVLTAGLNETATLSIGNAAWTNYVVSLRANLMGFGTTHMLIGVRVEDLNNMVALDCTGGYRCSWVIIDEGKWDVLPTEQAMMVDSLTISAEGDTFIAVGNYPGLETTTMSIILPPKYQGKFTGGGVLLRITSAMEIDSIEIAPYP